MYDVQRYFIRGVDGTDFGWETVETFGNKEEADLRMQVLRADGRQYQVVFRQQISAKLAHGTIGKYFRHKASGLVGQAHHWCEGGASVRLIEPEGAIVVGTRQTVVSISHLVMFERAWSSGEWEEVPEPESERQKREEYNRKRKQEGM